MKNHSLFTPFCESTHTYKDVLFYVDYCGNDWWQCSDGRHIVRERGRSKQEVIDKTHITWDLYASKFENQDS
jgi:hypothetical protein